MGTLKSVGAGDIEVSDGMIDFVYKWFILSEGGFYLWLVPVY